MGGADVTTVRELPPLAIDKEEWTTIGEKMGWINVCDKCKRKAQAALGAGESIYQLLSYENIDEEWPRVEKFLKLLYPEVKVDKPVEGAFSSEDEDESPPRYKGMNLHFRSESDAKDAFDKLEWLVKEYTGEQSGRDDVSLAFTVKPGSTKKTGVILTFIPPKDT